MMMHTFGLSCTISHFSLRCRQWLWHVVYVCLIYPERRCSKWGGSIFDLTTREHPAHFILQERSALQAWLQYADVLHCLDCRVGGAGYLEIMNPCGWFFLSLTGNGLNFSLIYIRAVRVLWFGIAAITEYPSYCRIIREQVWFSGKDLESLRRPSSLVWGVAWLSGYYKTHVDDKFLESLETPSSSVWRIAQSFAAHHPVDWCSIQEHRAVYISDSICIWGLQCIRTHFWIGKGRVDIWLD